MLFEIFQGRLSGDWFWRAKSPNGRITADGAEGYKTKSGCRRALNRFVDAVLLLVDEKPELDIRYVD